MEKAEIIAKVCALLRDEFPTISEVELTAVTPLISSGLLDSFAVVTLISSLETAFSFSIDVEKLEYPMFESVDTISDLCLRIISST